MAASKGMPLLAAIAALMIVSYTVFRLNYAANNLPYDPGDPWPGVSISNGSNEELGMRLREAFTSRHSAKLITPKSADEQSATDDRRAGQETFNVWPLRGLELERAIRSLDTWIAESRQLSTNSRDASSNQRLANLVAARKLVDQDRAFVVEDDLERIASPGWNIETFLLFETKDRRRFFQAAIDTTEFEFVRLAATANPQTFDPR